LYKTLSKLFLSIHTGKNKPFCTADLSNSVRPWEPEMLVKYGVVCISSHSLTSSSLGGDTLLKWPAHDSDHVSKQAGSARSG
jgi:hypothetical protein